MWNGDRRRSATGDKANSPSAHQAAQWHRQTFSGLVVSNSVKRSGRPEDTMENLKMKQTTDASLSLFDEQGGLVGTIRRPVSRDPVGPGRETVYLAREDTPVASITTKATTEAGATMAGRPRMTAGAEAA
jgi:hypothetical protein